MRYLIYLTFVNNTYGKASGVIFWISVKDASIEEA